MTTKILGDSGREITVCIERRHKTAPGWMLLIQADGGPQDHFTGSEIRAIGVNLIIMTKDIGSTVTIS